MPQTNERLSSAFYDSVHQRQLLGHGPDLGIQNVTIDVQNYITGRLRLDTLISRKIVMPDTRIFDGIFFLQSNPSMLLQNLKRHPMDRPLEIQMRENTIKKSILGFVRKADNEYLDGFSFSSVVDSEQRQKLSTELKKIKSSRCRSLSNLVKLLAECGVDKSNCELLDQAWSMWIEAGKNEALLTTKWTGKFDLDGALGLNDSGRLPACTTKIGKDALMYAIEHRWSRSDVDNHLMKLEKTSDEEGAEEVRLVAAWINKGYNRAIAWQHCCDTFESPSDFGNRIDIFDPLWARAGLKREQIDRFSSIEYQYPLGFVWALGKTPSDEYQHLYAKAQPYLVSWWSSGDIDQLRRGLDVFIAGVDHKIQVSSTLAQLADAVGGSITTGAIGIGWKVALTAINEEILTTIRELKVLGGSAILGAITWLTIKKAASRRIQQRTSQKIVSAIQKNRENQWQL